MTIERLELIQYYALWFGVFLIAWAVVSIVIGAVRKARKAKKFREETSRGVRAYDAEYFESRMMEMDRKIREVGNQPQFCLKCGKAFAPMSTTVWYDPNTQCQCFAEKLQEKAE